MSFLNPITALIAAGITVPLLVSLYFLKLRRKPIVVPSTLLWKKAIQDLQVNAPFQRIRNNLLLWLQLLLLALLLLAMARPTQRAAVSPGERVVIVIDHSGSMNTATTGGETRLDEAKSRALELIDNLDSGSGGGGGAMVVSFAERAAVLQSFTNDRGLLRSAVRSITPTDQRSRIEPALGLIEPHTPGVNGGDAGAESLTVYVFSDGRLHRDGAEALALPGATLAFERIGEPVETNVGIVSASARRDYEQPSQVSVFARLINTGLATRTNVTLKVDGRAVRTRAVSLPAASAPSVDDQGNTIPGQTGEASVTFEVPLSGSATIELVHDQVDKLPADNVARLQLLPAQRLSVLLVTRGNRYLREAIRAAGARRLELLSPDEYEALPAEVLRDGDTAAGNDGYDVIVFDRYEPAAVPPVSSLSFGAAVPVPGLSVRPSAEDAPTMQAVLTWTRDHPLMQYVVLDDVTLRRPGRLTVPLDAKVLAVGLAGPLIAETRDEQLRHVAVSFDVLESRWPHHWSFQIFMVNALETLGLSNTASASAGEVGHSVDSTLSFRAGESATVPVPAGVTTVGYGGPTRLSATTRAGRATLPAFTRVGFYEADVSAGIDTPMDRLAVNLLDPLESDVRPAERLEVGTGVVQTTAESSLIRREVWQWFAWAALGLLLVEWFVYTRRMRV
ncbi:MAG: BatA and WFA domain-containing protein [Planctomycetota bacterium]